MTIVSETFAPLGRREAEAFNMPDLPLLLVPHPVAIRSETELRQIAADLVPGILAALTRQEGRA